MTLRAKVLFILVLVLFLAGTIWLTWYLTRRQVGRAEFPLLPSSTTNQSSRQTETLETSSPAGDQAKELTLQLSPKFNLISFGHRLAPSDCKNVFANLSTRDVFALKQGKWTSCFNESEWSVAPGEGYFVSSKNGENLKISSQATPVLTSERFSIELAKGWNVVGNPFPKTFVWKEATIELTFGEQTVTFKEAVEKQYLSKLHRFNAITQQFDQIKDADTIEVNQGLLIQSGAKGRLILPGPGV